jgi:hypothetical protein
VPLVTYARSFYAHTLPFTSAVSSFCFRCCCFVSVASRLLRRLHLSTDTAIFLSNFCTPFLLTFCALAHLEYLQDPLCSRQCLSRKCHEQSLYARFVFVQDVYFPTCG